MTFHAPLLLDIAGTELNADDRRRLAHPLTAGLILFGRNWQIRAQITALCDKTRRELERSKVFLQMLNLTAPSAPATAPAA